MALRAGGLTYAEIAEQEQTTVKAIRCAMRRARRADAAQRADTAARLRKEAEILATYSEQERRLMADYPGQPVERQPDGSLRIAVGEGEWIGIGGNDPEMEALFASLEPDHV